jgi:hypothetical protein
MGILVALDVLFHPADDEPRVVETVVSAVERLTWVGRPVILVGAMVGGRRLPADADERVAWTRHALGDDTVAVVPFEPPASDRHGDSTEALERWRALRKAHHARWLIESGWRSPRPDAGLTVIEVGGRAAAVDERADRGRDLLDATNQLLMTETFRPATWVVCVIHGWSLGDLLGQAVIVGRIRWHLRCLSRCLIARRFRLGARRVGR